MEFKAIEFDPRLKHPMTMIISGPTGCGKTVFVNKLLKSDLFNVKFSEIIWCYSEIGSISKSENITYVQGIVSDDVFDGTPKLVILDDLMHEADDRVAKMFTKGSHHKNISVIFISQNLFHQSKVGRDIALNSHYLVSFKNPRDKSQIAYWSRQLYPEKPKYIQDSFLKATQIPHAYLMIDLKQDTNEDCRIRTDIFQEFPQIYIPE